MIPNRSSEIGPAQSRATRSGERARLLCRFALRRSALVLLLLLLVTLIGGIDTANGAPSPVPRVSAIEFVGNDHLESGELRSRMRLRQPAWWKPFRQPRYPGADFLASDLYSILERYQEAGFPFARVEDAVVTWDDDLESVRIRIQIDEGPRVHLSAVRLRGLAPGWEQELRPRLAQSPGRPLSWPDLLADRDRALDYAVDRGHALATADLQVRYEGDAAEAIIDVDPGPPVVVESIRIDGLSRSRESMARRELTLRPGSLLTGRGILDSQERLLGTGVFQRARVLPQFPDSSRPVALLVVSVDEKRQGWYGAGAGFTSADRLRLVTEWGVRNFTGMGRRIGLTGNLYYSLNPDFREGGFQFREGLLQADYVEPWLLHTRTRGLVSPYIRWLQEESFHQRTLGYSFTLRRDFRRASYGAVGLQSKHVTTTEAGVLSNYTTRFVNLDLAADSRDNPFDPARGRLAQTTAEYAGGLLGGTNEFARFTLSWQSYASAQPGWVFAGRVKAGWIQPIGKGPITSAPADTLRLSRIPWEERFRIGGSNTIRGYSEGSVGRRTVDGAAIGGLATFLASAEIRFPVAWILQGGLFADAGNVWADPSEVRLRRITGGFRDREYDPLNLAYGMGVGLRFRTPVGPFRFDYAFKMGSGRAPGEPPGELHVALGQAF